MYEKSNSEVDITDVVDRTLSLYFVVVLLYFQLFKTLQYLYRISVSELSVVFTRAARMLIVDVKSKRRIFVDTQNTRRAYSLFPRGRLKNTVTHLNSLQTLYMLTYEERSAKNLAVQGLAKILKFGKKNVGFLTMSTISQQGFSEDKVQVVVRTPVFVVRFNRPVAQLELLGQFRLIGDRASDVSGERICLTQNAYAEIQFLRKPTKAVRRLRTYHDWKINTILFYSSLFCSIPI